MREYTNNILGLSILVGLAGWSISCGEDSVDHVPTTAAQTTPSDATPKPPANAAERQIAANDKITKIYTIYDPDDEPMFYVVKETRDSGVSSKYAIHRDGEIFSIADAERAGREAWFQRWGYLDLRTVTYLKAADDDEIFDLNHHLHQSYHCTNETDCPVSELERQLSTDHIESTRHRRYIKIKTTKSNYLDSSYRWTEGITRIGGEPETLPPTTPSSSNGEQFYGGSADYSNYSQKYNSLGYYGEKVKVGLVELFGDRCGIYDNHSALEYAEIYYEAVTKECDPKKRGLTAAYPLQMA